MVGCKEPHSWQGARVPEGTGLDPIGLGRVMLLKLVIIQVPSLTSLSSYDPLWLAAAIHPAKCCKH